MSSQNPTEESSTDPNHRSEVADDTEIGIANVAIRALNATDDVETAEQTRENAEKRLVADGGVPESFTDLASTCENCGDDVDPERLIEGECPGCHYRPMADGGVSWYDLTAFQRDCLQAIAAMESETASTYGLGIKRRLEEYYGCEINHGRLYPNLDELVGHGLVEKGELDKRTNSYGLTAAGREMLRERQTEWEDLNLSRVLLADGGEN